MTSWRFYDDDQTGPMERFVRAAEYVRMSTDLQKYSTENQSEAIRQYAKARGIKIVRTYADAGKSGLKIEGRNALRQLIEDVQAGNTDFTLVLVYDVSRWGRFQDADESAYYEYICRRAGIAIEYCAEQFENDGSPISTIVKGVKRAMAGEYSRELSTKVFAGQGRLIEKGYRQGGPAGFGLRRTLIDENGTIKGILGQGEHKSIQTDRVILTPGPIEEINLVRTIYQSFVYQKRSEAENAFEAIVERELFESARNIINTRSFRLTDEEMLHSLKELYHQKGLLSGIIIDECDDLPSSGAYSARFGSLLRAYHLVGFKPDRDYRYIAINRELRRLYPKIIRQIITELRIKGSDVWQTPENDRIVVNDEFSLSVTIARCIETSTGLLRWKMHFDTSLIPDITIVVRMDSANRKPLDYYLFPRIDIFSGKLHLSEENSLALDAYRFDNLELLYDIATPISIVEVA